VWPVIRDIPADHAAHFANPLSDISRITLHAY
jgi:hypothetical protein